MLMTTQSKWTKNMIQEFQTSYVTTTYYLIAKHIDPRAKIGVKNGCLKHTDVV